MDYNTLIVLSGLACAGLLLGSFGALVSLKGENLSADVAGHGVVTGAVVSQGLVALLAVPFLSVPLLWILGSLSSALTLVFVFWMRRRGFSPGVGQALGVSLAYGSSLVLVSLAQGWGLFPTKGLTTLLLGDAATLTFAKIIPSFIVLIVGLGLATGLSLQLKNWVLDPAQAVLMGTAGQFERLWLFMTVAVVLSSLPSFGLIVLVGVLSLPALITRPWVRGFWPFVVLSGLTGMLIAATAGLLSAGVVPVPTGALVITAFGGVALVSGLLRSLVLGLRNTHVS